MMENNKYIALTFGPISRALSLAESTKELWAASYFFSYLAKNIVCDFAVRGDDYSNFLLPKIDTFVFDVKNGVGLFPDRYIFRSNVGDFERLEKKVECVLSDIAREIHQLIEIPPKEIDIHTEENIKKFLCSFIKVYFIEKEFDKGENEKDIIKYCEQRLSFLELQDTFSSTESTNYLKMCFQRINGKVQVSEDNSFKGFEGSFLSKDAFENPKSTLFESLIEISAADLKQDILNCDIQCTNDVQISVDIEDVILQRPDLKPYHKYVAIVKADGDSIGKAQKEIGDIRYLSNALLDFSNNVGSIISSYKGMPVYIGGDDLLFFAPVCVKSDKGRETIFDLIKKIDDKFEECLKKYISDNVKLPTLSYGVSISYFKYPMCESLENAGYLLESVAKGRVLKDRLKKDGFADEIIENIPKNKLSFSLQKHSGRVLTTTIHKDLTILFDQFIELISSKIGDTINPNTDLQFLSSVMYKIEDMHELMAFMLRQNNREKLIHNFFENNFNENVHKANKEFFRGIESLLLNATREIDKHYECFNQDPANVVDSNCCFDSANEAVRLTISALRFIHFVNSDSDE